MGADGRLLFAGMIVLLGLGAALLAGLAVAELGRRLGLHARAQTLAGAGQRPVDIGMRDGPGSPGRSSLRHPLRAWLHARYPALGRIERAWAAAGLGHRDCILCGAIAAGCAGTGAWAGAPLLLLPALAAGAGGLAVWAWWGRALVRRRARFLAAMPEALGLIVRGLRSGMPIVECVADVGREMNGPLGLAFRRASDQVRLGQPLERALAAETDGLNVRPMAFLLATLSIQRETGGNLADTLGKLDAMLRQREQMELRVRALSSEARASAWIIGSLPLVLGLMMWAMAPDYLAPLFVTTAGRLLLLLAAASLAVGGWLMAQIVRFDI
jgi:tight adherence protein B